MMGTRPKSPSTPPASPVTPEAMSLDDRIKNLERGEKVLAVATNLSADDIKQNAIGIALEYAGKDLEKVKEDRQKKIESNKIFNGKVTRGVVNLFTHVKDDVFVLKTANRYKNLAIKAIQENNSVNAGEVAISDLREARDRRGVTQSDREILATVENKYKNGKKDHIGDAALERAKLAVENLSGDMDVEYVETSDETLKHDKEVKKDLRDYIIDIASREKGSTKSPLDDPDTDREAMVTKMREGEKGRDAKGGIVKDNYDEIMKDIQEKFSGLFTKEFENFANNSKDAKAIEDHNKALEAIDAYIEKIEFNETKAKIGLAAKEVYNNFGQKLALENNLVLGVAVTALGSSVMGLSKSAFAKSISNSTIVSKGAKIILSTAVGTAAGAIKERRNQRKKNINDALSGEDVERAKARFGVVSVVKKTEEMAKISAVDEKNYEAVIDLVADLMARNKFQNEQQIQLLGYGKRSKEGKLEENSRSNIEEEKLGMFKEISRLRKLMSEYEEKEYAKRSTSVMDFDDEPNHLYEKIEERTKEIAKEFKAVRKEQRMEVMKSAAKAGATAFVVSSVASYVFGHKQLMEEINGLKDGSLKWNGLNLVPVEVDTAIEDATEKVADVATETTVGETIEPKEVPSGARLITEYKDGKTIIGFDTVGDEKIDTPLDLEGLNGSDIDLTDEETFKTVAENLKNEYNIELNREVVTSSHYGEMSIADYLEKQDNAVETGNVDWGKSELRAVFGKPVAISADGMDQYEVSVSGINGGEIPEGAKFFVDLDGNGPGEALEFEIQDGKVVLPADILDTSKVGNGGVANFIGTARVGRVEGDRMISYATAIGKKATMDSTLSASISNEAYAFTATMPNNVGGSETISQFALNSSNENINMSEIFNGVEVDGDDRLPAMFEVDNTRSFSLVGSNLTDGSSETLTFNDYEFSGGYDERYDAFLNKPFFEGKNYLGTPMEWDANGDGIMDASEQLSYFKQMIVRTGTNPYMLGQNASNYGILEPDTLRGIGIDEDLLRRWGIEDGVINSEEDLNIFLEQIKLPENGKYWDNVVNATIDKMEHDLDGGGFRVETITNRVSTYANSNNDFDTTRASTTRVALYPYHYDENGDIEYVGNEGWWCRKYGAEGGKVGDMPLCEQKCIKRIVKHRAPKPVTSDESENVGTGDEGTGDEGTGNEGTGDEGTGNEGTGIEATAGDEGGGSEPVEGNTPKNPEAIHENMGVGDESTNDLDQRGVDETPITEAPVFAENNNIVPEDAAPEQAAADAAEQAAGTTPDLTNSEAIDGYREFTANS